jgi:hypothetical protein
MDLPRLSYVICRDRRLNNNSEDLESGHLTINRLER